MLKPVTSCLYKNGSLSTPGVIGIVVFSLLLSACKPASYGDAPDFALQNQAGDTFQLSSFNPAIGTDNQQGDYLLINFWASWCVPCIREMPLLEKQHGISNDRLQIVGIAADQMDNAQQFAANLELNYALLYGEPLDVFELMEDYGNPQGNLPYSVLVSPGQEIIWRHVGQLYEEQLVSLPLE